MKSKIRVYGKSQSRTALGIINAYLKLYPDASLSELRQAFPKSLNPKSFTDNILVPEQESKGHEKHFFEREDELVVLKNGERLALVELWTKDDFEAICEHAQQYGIEVAEIQGTKPFEKGSYELEFLEELIPQEGGKKKCKFCWLWILLLFLLLLLLIFCFLKCCNHDKASDSDAAPEPALVVSSDQIVEVEPKQEDDNTVTDTGDFISFNFPDGKGWSIRKNSPEFHLFNFINSDETKVAASDRAREWINLDQLHFETGKAKLTTEAEVQLESVAMVLKFFPKSQVKIGGHTDHTGTDEINKRLSAERAKLAAEKLISSGIDKNRVTYQGYGSQYPVCPENNSDECRAANRRINISVTQK